MERWRAHVANAVEMFTLDLRTLAEPRGFIRVLQLLFAILAFSAACSYQSTSTVSVNCDNKVSLWTVNVAYPFATSLIGFEPQEGCKNQRMILAPAMACGVRGKAEFFVTIGVLSLFVCLVSLPVYLCKTEYYENNTWLPLVDFGVTAGMALMWFISSCLFGDAVSTVKSYANPANLAQLIPTCKTDNCTGGVDASYNTLNIATILGFTNIILWAGSSWFVYKETPLHTPPQQTSSSPQPQEAPSIPPVSPTTQY